MRQRWIRDALSVLMNVHHCTRVSTTIEPNRNHHSRSLNFAWPPGDAVGDKHLKRRRILVQAHSAIRMRQKLNGRVLYFPHEAGGSFPLRHHPPDEKHSSPAGRAATTT